MSIVHVHVYNVTKWHTAYTQYKFYKLDKVLQFVTALFSSVDLCCSIVTRPQSAQSFEGFQFVNFAKIALFKNYAIFFNQWPYMMYCTHTLMQSEYFWKTDTHVP